MAAVGLFTAVWILAAVYRTSVARVTSAHTTGTPSVAFYRTLLERERTYHRTLPVWFVPPVLLSTGAIVLTFARSARFAHTPVFYGVMAWYVVSAGVALAIGLKKGRSEAARLQQELDALTRLTASATAGKVESSGSRARSPRSGSSTACSLVAVEPGRAYGDQGMRH